MIIYHKDIFVMAESFHNLKDSTCIIDTINEEDV
jgi:hypothetical protein